MEARPRRLGRVLLGTIGTAAVAVALCAPAAADPGEAGRAPNLLLISIDTLRADHCSAYGYHRDTTPNLKTLASQGARFEAAYAPSATTAPSHASFFTGVHPVTHGVVKNGVPLAAHLETLAERLAAAGYQTAGVVSSLVLASTFGFGQGFSFYLDDFRNSPARMQQGTFQGHQTGGSSDRPADVATRLASRWLWESRDPARPFFLFVHYFDPHVPYLPPGRFLERFPSQDHDQLSVMVRRYDAEVAFTDEEIGRLLEVLEGAGLAEETLVIVVGDHGEGLMQHGWMGHGLHLFEEQVRVPWIARLPGRIPPGRVLAEPVTLVDLMPTVLELLGQESGVGSMQGRSLGAALRGEAELDPERPVHLLRRHYKPGRLKGIPVRGVRHGLRVGRWKWIGGGAEGKDALYDLEADPGETRDLRADEPGRAREMADRVSVFLREHARDAPASELSAEDREALEALGYVQ